ncbi:MAG: hypothetical protein ACD_69C00041G0003 [uncultured bacterium]|nr:MAG: hypothetical protein ACD_69C00041G0003 [uncultured bacterium]HBC72173.1 hypothetical protein [Coxiellaceae bacterium]
MEDTNRYQIPSSFNGIAEQRNFWTKIVEDQIASGMGAEKFCEQHQITFTKFHYWKYSKIRPDCISSNENNKTKNQCQNRDVAKFVSLKIAPGKRTINHQEINGIAEQNTKLIEIIFKNGHKIIWPSVISDTNLLLLIKAVGEL